LVILEKVDCGEDDDAMGALLTVVAPPGRETDDDLLMEVEPSMNVMVVSVTVSIAPSSCVMVRVDDDMDCGCCVVELSE
jgi:hypothetical protein